MGGLAFGIPARLISLSSIVFGGASLLASLLDVIRQGRSVIDRRVPTALYTLAVAVAFDLALLSWLGSPPAESLFIQSKAFPWLLIAGSCIFLIITMILLRAKSGPGINALRIGAKVLLVIAFLGTVAIIV
jgi:hypothetical protein